MILLFYTLYLFFALVTGDCFYNTTIKCKPNEIFNPCPEYCTFDETCASKIFGAFQDCPVKPLDFKCQPRCECKPGYIRIDDKCETIDKCCSNQNEEVVSCPARCEETCNSSPKPGCKTDNCFEIVCRCKKGFARNFGWECIPLDTCETTCELSNAVYNPCGPVNHTTCRDRNPINNGPCVRDCYCKEGYIKDKRGRCIPIENCPLPCSGDNEEITECGTCDPTCENLNPICPQECVKGCFCKKGFVRDDVGDCIDPKFCPIVKRCEGGKIWMECHGWCDPSCGAPNRKCNGCRDGCFCKDGYVIDRNNVCVKRENCPVAIKCEGQNEEFSDCINKCPFGVGCINRPCTWGCVCKSGFVRRNGICVSESETTVKPTNIPTTVKPKTTPKLQCITSKATNKPIICGNFETYSTCLPEKEPTCEDQLIVPGKVCKSGCTCKPGHVRENGKCIPAGECKQKCYH